MATRNCGELQIAIVSRRKDALQLLADTFRQTGAGSLGRDRDGQLTAPQDRWQDEGAACGHIYDIDQLIAFLRLIPDRFNLLRIVGGCDDDEGTRQISWLIVFGAQLDALIFSQFYQFRAKVW